MENKQEHGILLLKIFQDSTLQLQVQPTKMKTI